MKTNCCICGKEIIGFGNNPWTIKDSGYCCDECNSEFVLQARIEMLVRGQMMARPIDADKLRGIYKKWIPQLSSKEDEGDRRGVETCIAVLEDMPTMDAVEVVRCKDCKYGEVDDADLPTQYLCNYHGADWNDENHFCSYGERKDGDGNG